MANIRKVWEDRIEGGIFSKGICQQFTSNIATQARGYMSRGKRSNLTEQDCRELAALLRARGGVKLESTHTEQGLTWLRRNGRKALGADFPLDEVLSLFDHFLYTGEVAVFGEYANSVLPVWTIVLTDGRQIRYYNSSWQVGAYGGGGDRGWDWIVAEGESAVTAGVPQ